MLLVPSIIFYKKNKKIIYLLWLAFIVSIILAFVTKLIVLRQRPIEAFTYPFVNIINYSFPSMHAMVVFSLLPFLVRYLNKWKSFWIGFGLLALFGRVYFGFHFLSDVVFGAFFGYFVGDYLLELYEKGKLWKNR
jgi:membrane-associated phospholipid phosphatase